MKQHIFNIKTSSKMNKEKAPSKTINPRHLKEDNRIWGMSATDALRVNYIDSNPTQK